ATGQLTDAKQYRTVIVAYRNGSPVRLGDLGTVIDGAENDRVSAWYTERNPDGSEGPMTRAVVLGIQRQPGANTVEVAAAALTLAVGFVVDDAIVMLENIVRHLDMGKPPLRAALDGSAEVGFTIVSMTVSLVAVFIPVLFMAGMVGRLLREFAVTISVAIAV